MTECKKILPTQVERIETGILQFGDDWPGVFIRGDDAIMGNVPALNWAIDCLADYHGGFRDELSYLQLKGLRDLLLSCME